MSCSVIECRSCVADLSEDGALRYTERYGARLRLDGDARTVIYDSASVDSRAVCAVCSQDIVFTDVISDT